MMESTRPAAASETSQGQSESQSSWANEIWAKKGVWLLIHNESYSRERNEVERGIIEEILNSYKSSRESAESSSTNQVETQKKEDSGQDKTQEKKIGIVTPFRAQRALLLELVEKLSMKDQVEVNTVEKFQGDERETIIYSVSISDMSSMTSLKTFLLDSKRTLVAFSRAKERLIVVVSQNFLNYIPPDKESYDEMILWKELRKRFNKEIPISQIPGYVVKMYRKQ